jgi:hypothetical protein
MTTLMLLGSGCPGAEGNRTGATAGESLLAIRSSSRRGRKLKDR